MVARPLAARDGRRAPPTGLFRACMEYLGLFWQAHATASQRRLGGVAGSSLWAPISAADMQRARPG